MIGSADVQDIVFNTYHRVGFWLALVALLCGILVMVLNNKHNRGENSWTVEWRCYYVIGASAAIALFYWWHPSPKVDLVICLAMLASAAIVFAALWFRLTRINRHLHHDNKAPRKRASKRVTKARPRKRIPHIPFAIASSFAAIAAFLIESANYWLMYDPNFLQPSRSMAAHVVLEVNLGMFVVFGVLTVLHGRKARQYATMRTSVRSTAREEVFADTVAP